MPKHILSILALTAFLSITGCGFIPHDVTISPDLPVQKKDIGKGNTLSVTLRDDRDTEVVGYRTYSKTGKITIDQTQNLVDDIKTSIEDGFRTLNFVIVDTNGSRNAKIDIRLIEFESVFGFFTAGSHARATFKVRCTVPSGKEFENTYRIDYEHRYFFIPFKSKNRRWINEAVSDGIMELFNDRDLMEFLEQG